MVRYYKKEHFEVSKFLSLTFFWKSVLLLYIVWPNDSVRKSENLRFCCESEKKLQKIWTIMKKGIALSCW